MVKADAHRCAVKKCYNTRLTHPDLCFFGFPNDFDLCQKWLEKCGRTDLDVAKVCKTKSYYKLCADHFEAKWFTDNSKTRLRRNLNPVPTIFVNNVANLLPNSLQVNSSLAKSAHANIDLSEEPTLNNDDPVLLCETVVGCKKPVSASESPSISYHSSQICKKDRSYDAKTISKALRNLNPETELHEISEMCRFCMNKTSCNYIEMFSNTAEATAIRNICKTLMPKQIEICDGLPHRVCQQCVVDLKTCHKLLDQFKTADSYLRTIAKYSLFIETGQDRATFYNEEDTLEELVKPIPKNALVMPLKSFKPVLEETEHYLDDISVKIATSSVQDNSSDKEIKYGNHINEALISDSLIPNEEDLNSSNEDMIPANQNEEDFNHSKEDLISANQNKENLNHSHEALISANLNGEELDGFSEPVNLISDVSVMETSTSVPATSVDQLLQMPLAEPLIPDGLDLWQDGLQGSVEMMVTDQENASTKKISNQSSTNQVSNKDEEISLFDLGKIERGEGVKPLNMSDCVNGERVHQENCEYGRVDASLEDFDLVSGASESGLGGNEMFFAVSYKCVECCNVFSSYLSLAQHVCDLSNLGTYSSLPYKVLPSSDEHFPTIRQQKYFKFKCSECGEEGFNNISELNIHVKSKHSHKCLLCKVAFYKQSSLKKHIASKHTPKTERATQLKNTQSEQLEESQSCSNICRVCGSILKSRQSILEHLKLHNDSVYTCEVCNKTFKTHCSLTKHLQNHRPEYYRKPHPCQTCSKRFFSKSDLKKHVFTHSGTSSFKCEFCDARFRKKHNFILHERKRRKFGSCSKSKRVTSFKFSGMPTLECDVCGRKFIKKSSVRRHQNFHFINGNPETIKQMLDEPEVNKCDICGRYLYSKLALQHHMRTHTGCSKPFKCEFCEKLFKNHHQVVVHHKSHTLRKCGYCKTQFHSRHAQLAHELLNKENESSPHSTSGRICNTRALNAHTDTKGADKLFCGECEGLFVDEYGQGRKDQYGQECQDGLQYFSANYKDKSAGSKLIHHVEYAV